MLCLSIEPKSSSQVIPMYQDVRLRMATWIYQRVGWFGIIAMSRLPAMAPVLPTGGKLWPLAHRRSHSASVGGIRSPIRLSTTPVPLQK